MMTEYYHLFVNFLLIHNQTLKFRLINIFHFSNFILRNSIFEYVLQVITINILKTQFLRHIYLLRPHLDN